MEPNKMEEDFRKKLNARELQPSEAAWDRLDAMLSVAENKKPKRNNTFLFMAASLALFFAVGLFLFTEETNNEEVLPKAKDGIVTSEPLNKTENITEDSNTIAPLQVQETVKQNVVVENHLQAKKESSSKQVLKPSDLPKQIVKEEIALSIQPDTPDNQKVNVESEKLLANADKAKEKPQVKVNVNSLLSSVEGELNQEFRETTLQRLNRNFKTVKTAVANRNYE
jgi:hypothetical protein